MRIRPSAKLGFVLFVVCFLQTFSVQAQIDTIGIYFRHSQDPTDNIEELAWKQWEGELQNITQGSHFIEEAFPNALRTSLTWMRRITVSDHEDYLAVLLSMYGNSIFDLVSVETNQIDHNGDMELVVSAPMVSMDTVALPECGNPYIPNDPDVFAIEDHFKNLQMACAWSITTGSPDVTVGIVDIYFDPNNADLTGKFLNNPGCDTWSIPGDMLDPNGNNEYGPAGTDSIARDRQARARHGTAMAGGVAAVMDNNKCLAGTGGATTVRGYCVGGLLSRIRDAIDAGNPVVSISVQNWQFTTASQRQLVRDVFEDGIERGVTFTFAINGLNGRHLENIPGLLNVGFGWRTGAYRPYERDGFADQNIEFIVPASGTYTLHGQDSCRSNFGGSSIGAAYLAGIVALMLDVNPCLTPLDIEQILYESSDRVNNESSFPGYFDPGKGRINAYQAVLEAQNYGGLPSLTIVNGETKIIQDTVIRYNDIKVETGGVLEINSSSILIEGNTTGPYQNGRIVVERGAKLIVRNSKLTSSSTSSLCADNDWSGIRVHGNIDLPQPNLYDASGTLQVNTPLQPNEAGVVLLLEGTIIEKAYNAVATAAPGYPYQEQVNRWGGLVIADNVVFRNNFRAAEFTQYPRRSSGNTFTNQSTFNNCRFITEDPNDDRSLGITLWDTDGVKITLSEFQNIGRESILTIDGSFVVENGNKFSNDIERPAHRHLSTLKTYPYDETSRIGSDDATLTSNFFWTRDADDVFIHSADSDPADPLTIINNDFAYDGILGSRSDAPAGIELVGPQRYLIADNNFSDCRRPIVLDNTGAEGSSSGNSISCNTFSNSNGPLQLENNNEGTQIAQNTFSGAPVFGQISTNMQWNGPADFQQGNASNPVNNKFLNMGAQLDVLATTNTELFLYWYTDDVSGALNVFEPRGTAIGYIKEPTIQDEQNICGQGIPPGIQGPNSPSEIETVRSQLVAIEQYLVSNPTDTLKLIERQETRLELIQRVNQYVRLNVSRGDVDPAVNVLNTLQTAGAEMRSYGIYVGAGRYADAVAKLPVINTYGPEYDEFVYVQYVNLDRMTHNGPYQLTPNVETQLTNYAKGGSRFRGYSRALLLLLKNKRFYDNWDSRSFLAKSSADFPVVNSPNVAKPLTDITIFPNPSNGNVTISGAQLAVVTSIDVLSPTGRLLKSIQVSAREQLNIDVERIPGLYFLVFRGPHTTFSKKFIVE